MDKLLIVRTRLSVFRRAFCTPASTPPPAPQTSGSMNVKYRPSEFQKTLLVWTKKYKSKAEIPTHVSPDLIDRARSEARIKISNILMILTALASLGAIMAGKAAAKRGESVHKMNKEWHQQYQDEFKKKEEEAAAAAK